VILHFAMTLHCVDQEQIQVQASEVRHMCTKKIDGNCE